MRGEGERKRERWRREAFRERQASREGVRLHILNNRGYKTTEWFYSCRKERVMGEATEETREEGKGEARMGKEGMGKYGMDKGRMGREKVLRERMGRERIEGKMSYKDTADHKRCAFIEEGHTHRYLVIWWNRKMPYTY